MATYSGLVKMKDFHITAEISLFCDHIELKEPLKLDSNYKTIKKIELTSQPEKIVVNYLIVTESEKEAIIKKKKWGIEWRLSMIPLGGYTSLVGETDNKNKKGFLAQRYSKKVAILVAGVAMNFLLACICYLILYKSITKGIIIDFTIIKVFFTKDYATLIYLMEHVNFNHMLLQLSIINIFCCLNLLPIYPMDGGIIVWGRIIEKNFHKYADLIQRISMIILWVLQIALLFYVWFI